MNTTPEKYLIVISVVFILILLGVIGYQVQRSLAQESEIQALQESLQACQTGR